MPRISRNTADLYVFDVASRELKRAASVDAPPRWRYTTRYAMHPRVLPDGGVVFMTRGCPPGEEQCNESLYFQLRKGGEYRELPARPEVTRQESANLKQCTSYLTYDNAGVKVNIGPTGGPWKPVLVFSGGELAPLK